MLEAIFLVVLVVIVFLQRWRAAIIPVVAIPVSLIGTANRSAARARFDGSRADERAALATFDDTVLQALQETEAALSNYRLTLVRRDALRSASDEAAKATTITQARQREGDISSLELLDAERTSAESQAAVAEADARIAQAQVGLFRALGGNWAS